MSESSASARRVVYAAVLSNVAIAVIKCVAAVLSGSAAMWSETVHSFVDTGNSLLLLVGARRSRKPADREHPFGHGKELYVWSLLVAVSIFGVGGGLSIYEGILHLLHPQVLTNARWSYAVLALAAAFEARSLWVAVREFRAVHETGRGWWRAIRASKDPTVYTVLAEDMGALLGIVLAFTGIALEQATGSPAYDAAASIAIGALLVTISGFLILESKGLLVGESADPALVRSITDLVTADPAVERAAPPLTMHLAPNEILVNLGVQFHEGLELHELERAIERLDRGIRERHPDVQRVFIEAEALRRGRPPRSRSEGDKEISGNERVANAQPGKP